MTPQDRRQHYIEGAMMARQNVRIHLSMALAFPHEAIAYRASADAARERAAHYIRLAKTFPKSLEARI